MTEPADDDNKPYRGFYRDARKGRLSWTARSRAIYMGAFVTLWCTGAGSAIAGAVQHWLPAVLGLPIGLIVAVLKYRRARRYFATYDGS
jgi:hypothetical protein